MTPTFTPRQIATENYGEHVRAAPRRQTSGIDDVELHPTAQPPRTVMMPSSTSQPADPARAAGPAAATGAPKSTSVALVGGESWMQYSFNIPWSEEHGIVRFIAAARQRFAQHE
jgi:hypothetical protein